MIKITKETELKPGMKVKYNSETRMIVSHANDLTILCLLNEEAHNVVGLGRSYLKDFLIEENAELIEDNAKVVVSQEVADLIVEINHKDMFMERNKLNLYATAHEMMAEKNIELRSEFFDDNEITEDEFLEVLWTKEFTIKRWRGNKGEPYYTMDKFGNVIKYIEDDSVGDDACFENFIYWKTYEQAEVKAKKIKDILRGEG